MDKYAGIIGFVRNYKKEPGVYEDEVTERKYRGDILRNNQRFNTSNTISGDIKITNQFSIMADRYAWDHVSDIRYLVWRKNRWIIEDVDISQYPRLIVSIGGIYNGPQATIADNPGSD